jgi:hypothetical protein
MKPDYVRRIRRLFGVNDKAVVDGRVCRHDNRFGGHSQLIRRGDARILPADCLLHLGAGENLSALPSHGVGQAAQVFEGMDLGLTREANRTMGIKGIDRRALHPFHRDARSHTCVELLLEVLERFIRRLEQITIQPFEVAIDALGRGDFFYAIDRRAVALRRDVSAVQAMKFLEIVIAIVQRVHQMRRGAAGHAPPDCAVVENDHCLAGVAQFIRDRQSGNTRAHNANVCRGVFAQGMERRLLVRRFPKRQVCSRPFILISCHNYLRIFSK